MDMSDIKRPGPITHVGGTRPLTGEAPFGVNELFFSRTDTRGVISAFNSVFLRIAHFTPDQMLGAPHKIIRHEDMPKGVFWLLWAGIQAGIPIGAYVKNKSSDGLYYWVYAVITPIDGGYLSVRMKPTSALMPKVTALYAELLAAEKQQGLTPEQSAGLLLRRLSDLGFASYAAFQSRALATEMAARDEAQRLVRDRRADAMMRLQTAVLKIVENKVLIAAELQRMARVPINMRIIAARIERAGGPLSAISDRYREMSAALVTQLQSFAGTHEGEGLIAARSEDNCLFLYSASRLMTAARNQFANEGDLVEGVDSGAEMAQLQALVQSYAHNAQAAIRTTADSSARLIKDIDYLRRSVLSLDSIRIMSRVENGRMAHQHEGLESIIAMLDEFHSRIDQRLDAIAVAAQSVNVDAMSLLGSW